MKITVVGAILIIVGVVAALMILDGLSKPVGTDTEPNSLMSPDGGYLGNRSM